MNFNGEQVNTRYAMAELATSLHRDPFHSLYYPVQYFLYAEHMFLLSA